MRSLTSFSVRSIVEGISRLRLGFDYNFLGVRSGFDVHNFVHFSRFARGSFAFLAASSPLRVTGDKKDAPIQSDLKWSNDL